MSDWYSSLPSFGWSSSPFSWPDSQPSYGGPFTPSRFATVRYNNPGGMYPGQAANMFGSTGTGIIGGGHKIANFPTPVHGAAANMQNIVSGGYVGMPIGAAINKWSGGGRGTVPGYDPSQRITPEMTRDPDFMVPFMKAVAGGEAPGRYPMSDDQWRQAYTWYAQGRPEGPAAPGPDGAATSDAYAGPQAQGRKMPTNSLMDLMSGNAQAADALGQPASFGNALASRQMSLMGLGLGLLQPYFPSRGQSPWTNALQGYMAGAQADESSAQNAWKRSLAEREFSRAGETDFQRMQRDIQRYAGTPQADEVRRFYAAKMGETPQLVTLNIDPNDPEAKVSALFNPRAPMGQQFTDLQGKPLNVPGGGGATAAASPSSAFDNPASARVGYGAAGTSQQGFGAGVFGTQPSGQAAGPAQPQYRTGPKAQEFAHELRKEIVQLPEVKRISEAMPIYRSMIQSHGKDTRAADLDFVYGVAKIFDPDSVVREGEMKLVGQARTIPEDIQAWMGKIVSGTGTLPPEVRQRILEVAQIRMGQLNEAYKQRIAPYTPILQQSRLNPVTVLPGMLDMPELPPTATPTATSATTQQPRVQRWGRDAQGNPILLP